MPRWLGWCRRRRKRLLLAIMLPVILANVLAYMHAHAFTHYSSGPATPQPQSLSHWQRLSVLLTGVTLPRPENHRTPTDIGVAFSTHRIELAEGVLELWH